MLDGLVWGAQQAGSESVTWISGTAEIVGIEIYEI